MSSEAEASTPARVGTEESGPAEGGRTPQSSDALLDALADVIFELDASLCWVTANRSARSLLGFPRNELIGRPFGDIVAPERRVDAERLIRQTLDGGRPRAFFVSVLTREGDSKQVRLSIAPLKDADGRIVGLAGSLSDVSVLLSRQRSDARAARRRSTTALADGAAHAYSELLTAVMGHADLALLNVANKNVCREHLRSVLRTVLRARDLSEQLQAYGGRQPCSFEEENIADVVRRVEPLVRQVLPVDVELHVSLPHNTLYANMSASQFSQALLVLMVRAGRAIGDQLGLITLDVRERSLGPREANTLRIEPGPYAVFELTDTGDPIPSDEIDGVFEPFGSKRSSRGTGLELATVEGVLERHNGRAVVRSANGRGTTFSLYVPARPHDADAPGSETENSSGTPRVAVPEIRRVAVVDDDPLVRDTLVAMLRAFDIETVVPHTPEKALELLSVEAPRIDALVTDVRMPGMTGPELTIALRAVHPELPVLLVSGYSDVSLEEVCTQMHAVGFLPKPFTAYQLMAALRALMILPRRGRSHADQRARMPHSFGPVSRD